MVGHIEAIALEHDRQGRIDPLDLAMPGWAAHTGLVGVQGQRLLKFLPAGGAGKFI